MEVEIEVRESDLQIGELRRLAAANAEEQRELYRCRAEARGEFAEYAALFNTSTTQVLMIAHFIDGLLCETVTN